MSKQEEGGSDGEVVGQLLGKRMGPEGTFQGGSREVKLAGQDAL